MSGDRQGAVGQLPTTVTSGEGNGGPADPARPSWDSLSPLKRATIYPERCCDCGKTIPLAAIRCDEHEAQVQKIYASLARESEFFRKAEGM